MRLPKAQAFFFDIFLKTLVVSLVLFLFLAMVQQGIVFGSIDFIQYYTASKLLITGGDPYNAASVDTIQFLLAPERLPVYMYNPPVIFPLIYPLAFFDFEASVLLWRFLSLFSLVFSSFMLFFLFPAEKRRVCYCLIIALFLFEPFFSILYYGQLSAFMLIAFVLHLYWLESAWRTQCMTRSVLAGIALAFLTLKPHVFVLYVPLIFFLGRRACNIRLFSGALFSTLTLFAISFFIAPSVVTGYVGFATSPPIFWQTPTFGSWLQGALNVHTLTVRLFPTAIIFIAMCVTFVINRKSIERLSQSRRFFFLMATLPLCFLGSPYVWIFDYVLLLPSVFFFFYMLDKLYDIRAILVAALLCFYFLLCGTGFIVPNDSGQHAYIYFPLALLLLLFTAMTEFFNTSLEKSE